MKTDKIDHTCTSNVICPHCGFEDIDSWSLDDSDKIVCSGCEEEFFYEREISCTYSSSKINPPN